MADARLSRNEPSVTHTITDRAVPASAAGRWSVLALIVLVLCALPLTGSQLASGSEAASPREYELKAAFLYNFTKFIEWPPQSFPDAAAPVIVAVLGPPEFASELERVVRDRKINGRGILVKPIRTVAEAATAQMLFVSAAADPQLAELQAALAHRPIVTVGESAAFAKSGTITFVLQDDKVRFEINSDAAEKAGIHISSQLLKLAITIHKGV
jgi:hypothetical protein